MLLHLAICHTIVVDQRTKKYNSSSPDELALVEGARKLGIEFKGRDQEKVITLGIKQRIHKFQLLNICEFSSERKRMSVIVKDLQSGKILLLTKGADSVIENLLAPGQEFTLATVM